jgi:hypothetical protein
VPGKKAERVIEKSRTVGDAKRAAANARRADWNDAFSYYESIFL